MVRKALILTGFNPRSVTGGIETYTKSLMTLFESSGMLSDLVCASDCSNTYRFHNEFIGKVYAAGRDLVSIPSDGYQLILCHGYYGGGYFPKRLKTVTIFHSTHAAYAEAIKGLVPFSTYLEIRCIVGEILEQTAASGAQVIAVSRSVRQELESYYGLKQVEVIPNPVDTDFFMRLSNKEALRIKYYIRDDRKIGLFVGRWELSKGSDILRTFIKDLRDIFWIIVTCSGGEAPPEDDNVRVLSGLNKEQMREIYNLADFMLFPSRYEGFGLAAAEAMACGLPVVGTPVGFLAEAYARAPFSSLSIPLGLLDGDDTAVRVREKIEWLLRDECLYEEVCKASREFIAENFNLTLWQNRMIEELCLS